MAVPFPSPRSGSAPSGRSRLPQIRSDASQITINASRVASLYKRRRRAEEPNRRLARPARSRRITRACDASHSQRRIRPGSVLVLSGLPDAYRPDSATTSSSRVAMLIHPHLRPRHDARWGANQNEATGQSKGASQGEAMRKRAVDIGARRGDQQHLEAGNRAQPGQGTDQGALAEKTVSNGCGFEAEEPWAAAEMVGRLLERRCAVDGKARGGRTLDAEAFANSARHSGLRSRRQSSLGISRALRGGWVRS